MAQPSVAADDRVNVWIVEDDDQYRAELAALINGEDDLTCERSFRTAEELLQRLQEGVYPPAIVLMDIGLPPGKMDGISAVKELRRAAPRTEVAMVTVYNDRERIFRAFAAGAAGYLTKDDPGHRIISAIRDVADGGGAMSSKVAADVLRIVARLGAPPKDYGLTARQKEVLRHLCMGKQKATIARDLGIAFGTVDAHLRRVYQAFGVSTNVGAVIIALKDNVLGAPYWMESGDDPEGTE